MPDDKTLALILTLLVNLILGFFNVIGMTRKSRDELRLGERRAQQDREDAYRKDLEALRASVMDDVESQLARVSADRDAALAREAAALAARDGLAKLLAESNKREEGHAEAMRNAVPFVKAGGAPCNESGG